VVQGSIRSPLRAGRFCSSPFAFSGTRDVGFAQAHSLPREGRAPEAIPTGPSPWSCRSRPAAPRTRSLAFEPVGMIASNPLVIVVNPNVPVKTLKEFVAYVKATWNGGQVSASEATGALRQPRLNRHGEACYLRGKSQWG
jgi:hypothetical protein